LKLDVFVLKTDESFGPSGGTTSKVQEGRHLYPETLMSKHLGIAHPVAILEGAQILDKEPSLFLFRVVKAEDRS
jgi:hypothetical protein